MAKENENQQPPPPTDPVLTQLIAQAGGGVSTESELGNNFPYPVRPISGVAKGFDVIAQADMRLGGSVDRPRKFYGGHLLVNEKGLVARAPYDVQKESRIELMKLDDDVARGNLLNILHSRGFYGDSKPSRRAILGTGFEYEDLQAMGSLLYTANARGSTWEPIFAEVTAMPAVASVGGGRQVRVTSPEDLGVYLREESFRQLGRNLTRQELQQAILSIQNQQRQRAASNMDAPSLGVAAQETVAGVDPDRRTAMKLGRALELMFSVWG
jgi:hypothetical protein